MSTFNPKKPEEVRIQAYLEKLRGQKYYSWLKQVKGGICLQANKETFSLPIVKLAMALDYRKLYDYLLFEANTHFTRACFLKLAKRFALPLDKTNLDYELRIIQTEIDNLFSYNKGLAKEKDIEHVFLNAYRTALLDISFYYNIDLNVMEKPQFGIDELLNNPNKPNVH